MTYLPIYQDIEHTFASSDSLVHYTITDVNDNLLYEGSAYRYTEQEKAFIYINRIVLSNINIRDIAGPSLSWVNDYATFTAVVKEVDSNNTVYRNEYDTYWCNRTTPIIIDDSGITNMCVLDNLGDYDADIGLWVN